MSEQEEYCIKALIAHKQNIISLYTLALESPSHRKESAAALKIETHRYNNINMAECKDDENEDEALFLLYAKTHLDKVDYYAELSGKSYELAIKLMHRLDKNIPDDAELLGAIDGIDD